MTISELIAELSTYDGSMEVSVDVGGDFLRFRILGVYTTTDTEPEEVVIQA